jgi:hypothetical protein
MRWGGEWVKEDVGGVRVFILAVGEGEGSSCWALHGGAAQPTMDDGGRPEERRGTPVGWSVSTKESRKSSGTWRRNRRMPGASGRW